MNRILAILEKEWRELRRERVLISVTLVFPVILTVLAIAVVLAIGSIPDDDTRDLGAATADPALVGLPLDQLGQAILGRQFAVMFLLMPLIIPSVFASYSIVGEKNRRTLEPLLATPISTEELLLAKCLAALIPAVIITWIAAGVFAAALAMVLPTRVFELIINLGWMALLGLCSPLLALVTVALTVMVSARASDPRSAQQITSVIIVPIMLLFVGQLAGLLIIDLQFVLGLAAVLLVLCAILLRIATRVFQREAILTRWT